MTTSPTVQLIEPLSVSEREVLRHMADGLSDQEIADAMLLSINTVRIDHKQNIYDKLGLQKPHRNKKWAIYCARQLGLLDGDSAPITDSTPVPQLIFRQRHNLPTQLIPFVGREAEITDVQKLLAEQRLITILATGGMGKTRLALEVAHLQLDTFKDGVYFVALQGVSDIAGIWSQLASSVGIQFSEYEREPAQATLNFFGNKQILLVMDNFEHLLDGASIVSDIMLNAPDVKIIATSREKLRLSGEVTYTLKGMEFPTWETPEDALRYDAVKLLVQSAQRVKPDWTVTQENLDYVARVCRLTQGMPLGILLAMSWLDVLSLQEIADEIQKNIDFLASDVRDRPERHQSIRAIFDATWNRLTPDEQEVFMKMSIFRGGFTRKAAEQITGANLRILQALSNKALIQKDETGRYDIHELLRQYAENILSVTDSESGVHERHLHFYIEFLKQHYPKLFTTASTKAIQVIGADFENIERAWLYACELEKWNALYEMKRVLIEIYDVGFDASLQAMDRLAWQKVHNSTDSSKDYEILHIYMLAHSNASPIFEMGLEQRLESLEQLLQRAIILNHTESQFFILFQLAYTCAFMRDTDKALQYVERLFELDKTQAEIYFRFLALRSRLYVQLVVAGNHEASEEIFDELLRIIEIGVSHSMRGFVMLNTGYYHWQKGNWQTAIQYLRQSEACFQDAGAISRQLNVLHLLHTYYVCAMQLDNARALLPEIKAPLDELAIDEQLAKQRTNTVLLKIAEGNYLQAKEEINSFFDGMLARGKIDVVGIYTLWKIIVDSILNEFDTCIQMLPSTLSYYMNIQPSMVIFGCTAFLPMLQDQGDDIRSVELIALFNEHPLSFPLTSQHPYVLELQAQLQDRLDADTYQQAWQRGAQLDPMEVAPALLEEFTEIYGT